MKRRIFMLFYLIVRMAKVILFILIYGKAENDKKKKNNV